MSSVKRAVKLHGLQGTFLIAGSAVAIHLGGRHTYVAPVHVFARALTPTPALPVSGPESAVAQPVTSVVPVAAAPATSVARVSPTSPARSVSFTAGLEHERVQQWLNRLGTSASAGFQHTLGRMGAYAGMITAKLEARQMPHDLIYLAMIESEFNPNAKSPAHAVGLWQFMSATARRFGLTVKGRTDERRNPTKSTDAALTYLSNLHDRFGSWYLAAAAYNSGEGTVTRALQRVLGRTTGSDEDFFKILPVLPRETQDYVPKLIASAQLASVTPAPQLTPRLTPVRAVKSTKPLKAARPTSKRASARRAPLHSRSSRRVLSKSR